MPLSAASFNTRKQVDFEEVQETVNRLAAHNGVTAVLILNKNGDIVTQTGTGKAFVGNTRLLKATLDAAATYVGSLPSDDGVAEPSTTSNKPLTKEEREKKIIKGMENLSFVRIRTHVEEVLVAPKYNYVLVVVQDPSLGEL